MPPSESNDPAASVVFLVAQMLFCVVGINMCFGWWSVKQERVIKQPYSIPVAAVIVAATGDAAPQTKSVLLATTYGITLLQTLMGFLVSAVLLGFRSIAHRLVDRGSKTASTPAQGTSEAHRSSGSRPRLTVRDVPELLAMGFSNIFGSSLGYAAMRRLSYPISLTSKMCKMLPVMFVGFVWYHTRYPARKIVACFLITGGVIGFALWDQHSSPASASTATPSSSLLGLLLMVVNLLMDGYTNSTQDVLVKRHRWGGATLMMWTNLVSVVCVSCVLAVLECGAQPWTWLASSVDLLFSSLSRSSTSSAETGAVSTFSGALSILPFHDFSHFISFLVHCKEARHDLLLMSLLNAVGQLFIFHTISLFGTLAVTAMTLIRKSGSVLLSIYVHGHAVQPAQWAALSSIFVGIVAEGYSNVQDASRRQQRPPPALTSSSSAAAAARATPAPSSESVSVTPKPEIVFGEVVSPPIMSSSSSAAAVTESLSTTPVCAATVDARKLR